MSGGWLERAACRDLPIEESERLFFGNRTTDLFEGRRICMDCPVRLACLVEADKLEKPGTIAGAKKHVAGTWGGLFASERYRRRLVSS